MIADSYVAEIADAARSVLEREAPSDAILPRLRSQPISLRVWKAAAEVGWFRVLTDEAAGGLAGGGPEVAALFREIGRHLPAGPFVETVVAAGLIRNQADLGPDERVITFGRLATKAPVESTASVSGRADFVEHAEQSGLLLLRVELGGGPAIAAVDSTAAGVAIRPQPSFDLVGRPAQVELEGAAIEVLEQGEEAGRLLARIDAMTIVAHAGTLAGIAAEVLDMSVQYAKDRVQFDKPIGAFQAVQHRLAEMAVARAAIESSLGAAVALAGASPPDLVRLRAMHSLAAELARDVVLSALQVHGGIGFTDEHRLHVYLKRTLRLQALAELADPLAAIGADLLETRR
jgi:alkylation response protein AidB-like acyl-CoA dehydrogenase